MTDEILTIDEAARLIRVCPQTLRRAQWAGQLRVERVGRLVRVTRAALAEWRANGGKTTPEWVQR